MALSLPIAETRKLVFYNSDLDTVCKIHACEVHAYEIHAMKYTPVRCTPVRCTFVRYTPMRCTPVRCTPTRTPIRCTLVRCKFISFVCLIAIVRLAYHRSSKLIDLTSIVGCNRSEQEQA